MSTGYQIQDQLATYFITPTIVDWVDVFTRDSYRQIIMDSLAYCIAHKGLKLYGYVIMTNHLHLIVRSAVGKLSDTIGDFKKHTARMIVQAVQENGESRREWMLHRFQWNASQNERSSQHQVWMHHNKPEHIYSLDFFNQKLNYIHQNPVRAGWVRYPEDYVYSSARSILTNVPDSLPLCDWLD